MGTAVESPLLIEVTEDRLCAHLVLAFADAKALTAERVFAKVRELGIPVTDEVTRRVEELAAEAEAGILPVEPVLLAEGRAPIAGQPAIFSLVPKDKATAPDEDDRGRVDFHQPRIVTVQEGETVGTYVPEVPAATGQDVFGKPIPAQRPPPSIRLGSNLRLAEDGRTLLATTAGKVHVTNHEVSVVEVVEITGDVDYATGNVDSPTDVLIGGTVRETFSVESAGSITVGGAIEAAIIRAGTDLHVRGGITAHGERKVIAGGEIRAKFSEDAVLEAGGEITLIREAMHSRLHAGGRLLVPRGAVIGGYSYAREGAELRALGNPANARTTIAVGVDPAVLAEARKSDELIAEQRRTASRLREKIQPLLARPDSLTFEQRERANRLMDKGDAIAAQALVLQERRKAALSAGSPGSEAEVGVLVLGKLHAGVTVIIGDKMAQIDQERAGPVKIVRRPVNGVDEIVMVDRLSGDVHVLASSRYEPGTL